MNQPARLCVVVPCYNEEAVLPITAPLFLEQLARLRDLSLVSDESFVLFVDDGSSDATWQIVSSLAATTPQVRGISLSRNRGHQNALLAGLSVAREEADVSISIDCDGQDDMTVMEDMLRAYHEGCDIVYGVRSDRSTDSPFKRLSAEAFYTLMSKMGVECVFNHADYRLMSRRALEELDRFEEVNLFLRGLVPLLGFKTTCVEYRRTERVAGESRYPLKKMVGLAVDGITSLSIKPIRLIGTFGLIASVLSFAGVLWAVINQIMGNTVWGWASTISVICFMGGVQLLSLGVIGEYVGKTYLETKHRPRYTIERTTEDEDARHEGTR